MILSEQTHNLSPWFKPGEPPERRGRYQVKGWDGSIAYLEWRGDHFRDARGDAVPARRICCWRGIT